MNNFSLGPSDWKNIEKNIESIISNKEKGDAFEYFSYFYLNYFSYLYDIEQIYCPIVDGKSFPDHVLKSLRLEKHDHGVDGVYIIRKREYIAWQAKFRSKRASLTARELGTFWSEAEYADYRLIISNSAQLPKVASKKAGHLALLVDRFEHLQFDFFENLAKFYSSEKKDISIEHKSPRSYQEEILKNISKGFTTSNKGKLIAACGIGKTLISLWAAEEQQSKRVIFFCT